MPAEGVKTDRDGVSVGPEEAVAFKADFIIEPVTSRISTE